MKTTHTLVGKDTSDKLKEANFTTDGRLRLDVSGVITSADFLALTDTPNSYTGQTLKAVRVNAGETALEFFSSAGTGDFVGPASSTDNAVVRFDGTTGKLGQNSAVTIADTTGLIAGARFGNAAGVKIEDSDASHLLAITTASNLTADRSLTFNPGDTSRVVTIPANATISGTNTGDQTITLTGDVTGTGTGSFAATIAADAVTYAKIQNVTTNKLLGRATAGSGDTEEITLGTGLSYTGTTLNAASGSGDVVGPSGSTDNAIARYDSTTGKLIQDSVVTVADTTGLIAGSRFANDGLKIEDSNASHLLTFTTTSNLTADRSLTFVPGDTSRTVTIPANATISGTNTGDQTITLTGDVTGTGTGSFAATIANDAVTYAKIQNVATNKLLGRATAGSGDTEEITLGTGLSFTGTTLNAAAGTGDVVGPASATDNAIARFDSTTGKLIQNSAVTIADTSGLMSGAIFANTGLKIQDTNASHVLSIAAGSDITADRTLTLASGNADRILNITADTTLSGGTHSGTNTGDQTITLTGDVTGTGTGSFAATIAADAVTLAKMADMATDSILGRATAAAGNPEVLTALPFAYTGDVTRPADSNATTIANNAVTFAKMADIATNSLIGRDTAATGDPEAILLDDTLEMDGSGNLQRAALTGDVTAAAGGNATTIAADSVTYAKMQNVSAASKLLGRGDSGSGDPQEITLGSGLTMTGTTLAAGSGSGDVVGPASATDEALARFDSTTGKLLQNSAVTVSDAGAQVNTLDDAATTTVSSALGLVHNTSGTAANGFGAQTRFSLESSTTPSQPALDVKAVWADATHASRTAYAEFAVENNAGISPTNRMRIYGTGGVTFGGTADPGATVIDGNSHSLSGVTTVDASTGYRIGGAAAAGAVMMGDGTNFIGDTTPTLVDRLTLAAGSTTIAPAVFQSGTNLTTPVAGAAEFDGTSFYKTIDTTSGRSHDVTQNVYGPITANLSTRGGTIADYFDADSAFPTVTNGIYELNYYLYFLKTTNGTLTLTLTNTQTYTNLVATVIHTGATNGVSATANAQTFGLVTTTTAAAAFPVTASLNTAVNHSFWIRALAECGTAGNIRMRVTCSAGTITPLRGSYYTARRMFAGNVGTFVT